MWRDVSPESSHAFDVSPTQARHAEIKGFFSHNPRIMPHPSNPGRILRKIDLDDAPNPKAYIRTAHEHWQHIPLHVPDASFAVRTSLRGKQTGFASVDKIVGTEIVDFYNKQRTDEETSAIATAVRGLNSYYEWVLETNQPVILGDLGAQQCMYGRRYGEASDEPRTVAMVDLDPKLIPADEYLSHGWHHHLTSLANVAAQVDEVVTVPYSPYGAHDWTTF